MEQESFSEQRRGVTKGGEEVKPKDHEVARNRRVVATIVGKREASGVRREQLGSKERWSEWSRTRGFPKKGKERDARAGVKT